MLRFWGPTHTEVSVGSPKNPSQLAAARAKARRRTTELISFQVFVFINVRKFLGSGTEVFPILHASFTVEAIPSPINTIIVRRAA
jgi:hypothetical protein